MFMADSVLHPGCNYPAFYEAAEWRDQVADWVDPGGDAVGRAQATR